MTLIYLTLKLYQIYIFNVKLENDFNLPNSQTTTRLYLAGAGLRMTLIYLTLKHDDLELIESKSLRMTLIYLTLKQASKELLNSCS